MTRFALYLAACFLLIITALPFNKLYAQQSGELEYRPLRVTLIPGLSTNGIDATGYTARYSLNIIGGYHGGIDGYEMGLVNANQRYTRGFQIGGVNYSGGPMSGINIGGAVNYSRHSMRGAQISGIGNFTEQSLQGFQLSGLINSGYNTVNGLQIAGIGNIARRDLQGLQIAGVFNSTVEDSQGMVIAGFGNFNAGRAQGFMFSGAVNVARDMQAFSVAGILNATRNLQGFQVSGLANVAYRVRGMQVGLFNFARDFDGIPVGLVSLYGNGRHNIDIWMSDAGFQNVGLKLGTRSIYNMISLGYNPFLRGRDVWSLGWTIGSYTPLDEAWDNPRYEGFFRMRDFSIQNVQEGSLSIRLNSIYSYRYLLGYDIANGLGIYAGPTFNVLLSREARSNEYTWYSIIRGERGGSDYSIWLGFTVGMQIFPH
ncbi:MAG: hypothetical protein JJU13_05945 [Balneolaceae bacterium]|nr:hypothetical protein [Balneolaceae bacterium]